MERPRTCQDLSGCCWVRAQTPISHMKLREPLFTVAVNIRRSTCFRFRSNLVPRYSRMLTGGRIFMVLKLQTLSSSLRLITSFVFRVLKISAEINVLNQFHKHFWHQESIAVRTVLLHHGTNMKLRNARGSSALMGGDRCQGSCSWETAVRC